MTATPEAPDFGPALPETASAQVEFVSQLHWNPVTELAPAPHRGLERTYVRNYAAALEEAGFDYTLLPYFSSSPDSFLLASSVGAVTERIKPIVALRPNHTFPLVAAQSLATLDQLTRGRAVVHLISGGSDAEQARQGDYEPKERRYDRTSEYIDLLRAAWTEKEPFSHDGEFYRFDDFGPGFPTYSGEAIPISIGGQSDEAFQVGGAKADWFTFWGEPLAEVRKEIDRVHAIADAAGRPRQRIWVTFRPIVAKTDAEAWEKAYDYVGRIAETHRKYGAYRPRLGTTPQGGPQNVGSQRALAFAAESERFDRALWTPTSAAVGAGGASTALVGSYETVAAAILDYVDAGASVVSIRGYDPLNDVTEYGKHILPLVRQELAHRKATGQRGQLQSQHLGYYDDAFTAVADAAASSAA